MEYFKKYFDEVENWNSEEVKVHCPFHNDLHPSASINTYKDLFHCWVCDVGYNEEQFIARINGISSADAIKLLSKYQVSDNWEVQKGLLWSDPLVLTKTISLGLSKELIDEMKLGIVKDENDRKYLGIPVYYNNVLVDVRRYNIMKYENQPKMKSNEGARVGWLIPYDKFLSSNEICYLFEGEKDMLMARELGINAYTLTGGAGAVPNEYVINAFKDKDIVICYDNDDAGHKGMESVYKEIKDIVKSIKYIEIGDVVKENKEDFYDYIHKYNGNVFEFYTLEQHHFNLEEIDKLKLTTIKENLKESKLRKDLRSIVTITSEFADPYSVPTIVDIKKIKDTGTKNDTMFEGEVRTWFLEKSNMQDMLELIEVNAKNVELISKFKNYLSVPAKEPAIEINTKEPKTVFKSVITDKDNDGAGVSLDIYSFEKLNVGSQYVIDYRIYPHPTKNQKLIAVAFNVKLINDSNNYVINKDKLKIFKGEGSVKERLDRLYESAKHHIAKHLNYDIWLMSDLVFNSILDFNYGEPMKGALDVFFLGDTQVGKALPLYEKVLTTNGYKTMGEITKDDKVFCEDGTPASINYISYQGVRPVYRITFSDDTFVDCDIEHLWKVQSSKQRNCTGNYKVLTTRELMNIDYSRYSIDWVKPIDFDHRNITIDPYVLGVLLGDGSLHKTAKFTNSEPDIVDKIKNKYNIVNYRNNEYGISDNVTTKLRHYGLIGCNGRNKFIPKDYLINDRNTRLELLRGLLDTDGYVSKTFIEYSSVSKQLAEDVKFLVESLGGRCKTVVKHNKYGEYYRLYISFYNGMVPVSSKKHLSKFKTNNNLKRMIRDISYVGEFECQCINVNHESHTFITNNMTITHNSETTSKMVELYNFGHFLSLKTSTTVGLIGGSNKVDGSFCNTIGAIPRQHKRLAILEEFSGARPDFIKTMTDIRSSNELRISRVSGELIVPCKLRMITISNPINDENGNPRFLNTFPNGVMPLMELIKSAEDVARYDGFLLIPKVENRFNPFAYTLTGEEIPKECYEEKSKWVVTRGIDNVKFADGVESYIWEKAEELNKLFECNFPLFGTTTSKKLARFCVALASLLMNVDDSYENIIVTRDIVDFMSDYLIKIYTSPVFKLRDYAIDYRAYSEYNDNDIKALQDLYSHNSTFIDFIGTQNRTTRSNLLSISGLDGSKFSPIFNKMVACKFIRLNGDNVYPTNKFRKVYNLINKDFKTDIGNKVANSSGVEFISNL